MLKNFFSKKENSDKNNKHVMIAALLIHAAKMDENYTGTERKIISKALADLTQLSNTKIEEIVNLAEKKEQESNQIIEFTREIKKSDMKFRIKIIELLWKIIYSDNVADEYEKNLISRVRGLLYVSNKDYGDIKLKIERNSRK